MAHDATFGFPWPGSLVDGDLALDLVECLPGDPSKGRVPMLVFHMRRVADGATMGRLDLRLALTPALSQYGGHIAYRVEPAFRGHHYAARSVRLIMPRAREFGMGYLLVTCSPTNIASRRTCELAGGVLVDIVPLPAGATEAEPGRTESCRYCLPLSP